MLASNPDTLGPLQTDFLGDSDSLAFDFHSVRFLAASECELTLTAGLVVFAVHSAKLFLAFASDRLHR